MSRYWELTLSSPQRARVVALDFRRGALQFGSAMKNYSGFAPNPDPAHHIDTAASIVFEQNGEIRRIESIAQEMEQRQKRPADHDFHISPEDRENITAALHLLYRRPRNRPVDVNSLNIDPMERAPDFAFQAQHYQKPAARTSVPT